MSTTPAEVIEKRLAQANDRSYYDSVFRQMKQAFGSMAEQTALGPTVGGCFPDYPDIRPTFKEIGASQRILNTQFITLSRILRAMPEPEFPQVDKGTGEVRKQFFLERARGNGYADGGWLDQLTQVFLDGDGLGTGVCQIGVKPNPKTAYNKVDIKHIPLLQVLWDEHARSLSRARWVCLLHYVPVDIAEAMYGKKALKDALHQFREHQTEEPIECYRIFEYWDTGLAKGTPTRAVILQDIDQKPLVIEDNPYGCLPIAHYEHLLTPGMKRPIGRISLLTPGQANLNDMERRVRSETKRPGFDLLSADLVEEEDVDKINAGEPGVIARLTRPLQQGDVPYERVPGGEVSATTLQALEMAERDFIRQSGVNEFEQGLLSDKERTLGENQLLDQRSKTQSNWSVLQATQMYVRLVEKVMDVAKVADNDPVLLDINGVNVLFNDPEDPRMAISAFLEEPSSVVISEESILKGDVQQEMIQKIAILEKISALGPVVDPMWFAEEFIKTCGYDPKTAMGDVQQRMASTGAVPTEQQPAA